MSKGPYDAFISYRTPGRNWVKTNLLPRLEAAGLRVCVDYRDFKLGAGLLAEMERGVIESRFTLAVYTRDYDDSGFTDLENIMADHRGVMERAVRLIVILRDGTMPSLRLKARLMLDMIDGNEFETSVQRLIDAFAEED